MANKNIPVRKIGSVGVISDLAPYDTPVQAWSEAKNIRFVDGKAQKIGGSIPVFYSNTTSTGKPLNKIPLHLEQKPLSEESWFWATKNEIWETNGWYHTLLLENTPEIPVAADLNNPWTSTVIANSVIFNTSNMDPVGKSPDSDKFIKLPGWGVGGDWKAKVVRSYKNFVIAMNTVEVVEYTQRVRWSNIVPPNSLPADWGFKEDGSLDPASAGGYNDLTMAVGDILEGMELKDQFIIYTDKEVLALDYVGGNEIFRVRKIFSDAGILNTNCVAAFDNKHFVVSSGDIYVHNGSSKQSVVHGKVRDKLLGELTENSYTSVKVVTYEVEKEIWIFYAGSDSIGIQDPETGLIKEATKAAIYSWLHETWTFVDVPKVLDVKFGPVPNWNKKEQKIETWGELEESEHWDDTLKLWGGIGKDFKNQAFLSCSTDGNFYSLDQGDFNISIHYIERGTYKLESSQIPSQLTKYFIDMDELGGDIIGYKHILGIYPQIHGSGIFYFRVGGSHNPSGSIEWGPRERYASGFNYKVDIRKNYRYISLQVDNMTEANWDFTGYDFIVRVGGRR